MSKAILIATLAASVALWTGGCQQQQAGAGGGAMGLQQMDIVDAAAANGQFSTFVTAVNAAGLTEQLKGKGPFTVFAPTDAAFARLPAGTLDSLLKPENRGQLQDILKYHVVKGEYSYDDVSKARTIKTLEGRRLRVTNPGGAAAVNGAIITQPDIKASNGVIQAVDKVLQPPE